MRRVAVIVAIVLLAACSSSSGSKGSKTSTTTTLPSATTSSSTTPSTTTTLPGPTGGAVPAGFRPASVTFVSPSEGWVLGTASCGTPPCTSIVRTSDGGHHWVGIPAPTAALNDPNTGVSALRFATPNDGWAYGPTLWSTHDGGATWHQVTIAGTVQALEAANGVVHLVSYDNNGHLHIDTAPVTSDSWTASPVSQVIGAGPVPQAQLVLEGASGWMIEVDRTVVGGARLAGGTWTNWTPACATVEGPAVVAASSATALVAACNVGLWGGTTAPAEHLYSSSDGGATFADKGTIPLTSAQAVATPAANVVVAAGQVAAASLLVRTADGGHTWTTVSTVTAGGAWADVGFTTPTQGVAVDTGGSGGAGAALFMTYDAGLSWANVTF